MQAFGVRIRSILRNPSGAVTVDMVALISSMLIFALACVYAIYRGGLDPVLRNITAMADGVGAPEMVSSTGDFEGDYGDGSPEGGAANAAWPPVTAPPPDREDDDEDAEAEADDAGEAEDTGRERADRGRGRGRNNGDRGRRGNDGAPAPWWRRL